MVGKEDDIAGRVREELAREVFRGFPLVIYKVDKSVLGSLCLGVFEFWTPGLQGSRCQRDLSCDSSKLLSK